jgi:hypothetical protein
MPTAGANIAGDQRNLRTPRRVASGLDPIRCQRQYARVTQVHTPNELRELLLQLIVGAAGGVETQWRKVLSDVEKLPIATHAQSNWAVHPEGSKGKKAVIAQAVDLVPEQHRYVADD